MHRIFRRVGAFFAATTSWRLDFCSSDFDLRKTPFHIKQNRANLKGANLYETNFAEATYDFITIFPSGFDPENHGMIYMALIPLTPKGH